MTWTAADGGGDGRYDRPPNHAATATRTPSPGLTVRRLTLRECHCIVDDLRQRLRVPQWTPQRPPSSEDRRVVRVRTQQVGRNVAGAQVEQVGIRLLQREPSHELRDGLD